MSLHLKLSWLFLALLMMPTTLFMTGNATAKEASNAQQIEVPCKCLWDKNRKFNPDKINYKGNIWRCSVYLDNGACNKVELIGPADTTNPLNPSHVYSLMTAVRKGETRMADLSNAERKAVLEAHLSASNYPHQTANMSCNEVKSRAASAKAKLLEMVTGLKTCLQGELRQDCDNFYQDQRPLWEAYTAERTEQFFHCE